MMSTQQLVAPHDTVRDDRTPLSIAKSEWMWALAFMLGMSMCGLRFPLGYVVVLVVLLNRFVFNRYEFLIQITILFCRFALIGNETLGAKPEDLALVLSVGALFVCRRTPSMNKVLMAILLYVLGMFVLASFSEEVMSVQLRIMRVRWGIVYFIVPILMFAGKEFDIKELMRSLFPYMIIMCAFYVLDGFIVNGWIFLPFGMIGSDNMIPSTFMNPICHPLSFEFPRMYSHGLFFLALGVFPLTRYYRLSRWQWVLLILAFLASRTMTVIAGLVITYMIFRGYGRKLLLYMALAVVALPAVYVADKATGGFMRVGSTIDQFLTLGEGMDEEEMAEFASGRGAQILPKLEALYDQNREWIGFGFLHPEYTKKASLMIDNDLYIDATKAEEVVTAVEVAPVQTVLDMGYIGLLMQITFFFGLYFLVRHLRYSQYYLSVLVCIFILGISGYSGLNSPDGLIMLGFSLGSVLLADKREAETEREEGLCVS